MHNGNHTYAPFIHTLTEGRCSLLDYGMYEEEDRYNICLDCSRHFLACECVEDTNICPWCGWEYNSQYRPHNTADDCAGPFWRPAQREGITRGSL